MYSKIKVHLSSGTGLLSFLFWAPPDLAMQGRGPAIRYMRPYRLSGYHKNLVGAHVASIRGAVLVLLDQVIAFYHAGEPE